MDNDGEKRAISTIGSRWSSYCKRYTWNTSFSALVVVVVVLGDSGHFLDFGTPVTFLLGHFLVLLVRSLHLPLLRAVDYDCLRL